MVTITLDFTGFCVIHQECLSLVVLIQEFSHVSKGIHDSITELLGRCVWGTSRTAHMDYNCKQIALTARDSGKPEYEPYHDKTNKMAMHPAKTQISLGIRPV